MLDTEGIYGKRSHLEEEVDMLSNASQDVLGLTPDSIAFIKSKVVAFELLDKDEERDLAQKLSNFTNAIALLTIASDQSARELLHVIRGALDSTLKKWMLRSERRYFVLRREMNELVSTADNVDLLSQVIELVTPQLESNKRLSHELVEHVSRVEWPRPLMVAFAKRYGTMGNFGSTLERAIDEYLQNGHAVLGIDQAPSQEHRAQLDHYVKAYWETRDILVNANLKLVFHIARRYAQKTEYLPDLIQEGTIGLIRATEKFRLTAGYRFSTYAHQWIDSKVRKARVNIDKVVSISHDYNNDLLRISQCLDRHKIIGSRPSFRELSKDTNISERRLSSIMQLKSYGLSLDATSGDDEGLSLHARLADVGSDFVEAFLDESNADYLNFVMAVALTEREAYVVNERFGRLNTDPKTLQEVSHILGVSRERVRQLESSAVKKLSNWVDAEMLQ